VCFFEESKRAYRFWVEGKAGGKAERKARQEGEGVLALVKVGPVEWRENCLNIYSANNCCDNFSPNTC